VTSRADVICKQLTRKYRNKLQQRMFS
jgi:hypothetical protein